MGGFVHTSQVTVSLVWRPWHCNGKEIPQRATKPPGKKAATPLVSSPQLMDNSFRLVAALCDNGFTIEQSRNRTDSISDAGTCFAVSVIAAPEPVEAARHAVGGS